MVKSNHIAEVIGEDPTFVLKILAKLAKEDLVKAFGGRYGGYMLEKDPRSITVLQVYQALGSSEKTPHWTVQSTGSELFISLIISKAEEKFQSTLANYTIEDILLHKENPTSTTS